MGFTTPNLPEVEPEEFLRPLPARFGEKASEPAKLAQLSSTKAGRPVIVVDRLVDVVGVDFAGPVAVDRGRKVFDELTQSRLVIAAHVCPRGPALGLGPHGLTIPPPAVVLLSRG